MDRKESSGLGYLFAALGGLAAGVGIGMLIAPDEGRETRRKLVDWLKAKRAEGRETLHHKREQMEAAIDAGRKAYRETTADHKKPAGV